MNQRLVYFSLLVRDYDEAINHYVNDLRFELIEDTPLSDTKRWVIVKPKGEGSCGLLLAKASGADQEAAVGNQTGGRVFLFLHTEDFWRDYNNLLHHQVTIIRQPDVQPHGTVAVFADLYGNLWDLIEPAQEKL